MQTAHFGQFDAVRCWRRAKAVLVIAAAPAGFVSGAVFGEAALYGCVAAFLVVVSAYVAGRIGLR